MGAKTVLFFGDSNTRGAGVGVERRFAAVLERDLIGAESQWRFAVGHAESDFHLIPERLDAAIAKYEPSIIVLQCPTGPVCFWVRYPRWIQRLIALPNATFGWLREYYINADMRAHPADGHTRRDALYNGQYLDGLYRWNLSMWFGFRHLRRAFAARYGTIVKATRERYVQLTCRLRDRVRLRTRAPIVFLGLLPASEDYYPGYRQRAIAWCADLSAALYDRDAGCFYLDLHSSLTTASANHLLLSDGRHLTAEAHCRIADIVRPILTQLMKACDESTASTNQEQISSEPTRSTPVVVWPSVSKISFR